MNHGFRLKFLDCFSQELVVSHVADTKIDRFSGVFVPGAKAIGQCTDGSQRLHAEFEIPLAADKAVHNRHRVALLRKVQGCRPAAVTVAPQHSNFHRSSFRYIRLQGSLIKNRALPTNGLYLFTLKYGTLTASSLRGYFAVKYQSN